MAANANTANSEALLGGAELGGVILGTSDGRAFVLLCRRLLGICALGRRGASQSQSMILCYSKILSAWPPNPSPCRITSRSQVHLLLGERDAKRRAAGADARQRR